MHARRFHAPGRVNLIGEHTDYSGGFVLPAAISRGVSLEVTFGGDRIVLASGLDGAQVDLAADGSQTPDTGWGRYVAAVAAELADLGRAPVGMRGQLQSDLPTGSGLSSSAALEVALGLALCAAADLDLEELALAAAMQRAELRGVGVPCGIMDQAASVLGARDHAVFLDCSTLDHRLVPLPVDLDLVIVDSGVRRELGASAYAQRRTELEAALVALGGRRPQDVDPGELEELAYRAALDDVSQRRLRHVVTENARVGRVETALTGPGGADRQALGELFAHGHASLRDDFEVSVRELDVLVEIARTSGAVAARMTGGGFGGAIVALVEHGRVDDVVEGIVAAYADACPDRTATVIVTQASDGAGEVS
ncbi:MAG: galactokinase [Glaciecola sp.]|jgi:galactokinase